MTPLSKEYKYKQINNHSLHNTAMILLSKANDSRAYSGKGV